MAELTNIHDMSENLGSITRALMCSFRMCLVAVWSFGFR